MVFPSLSHHGGTRGVTGSCHQLHLAPHASLLIDCGLEQGQDVVPGKPADRLGFDLAGIRALIVTHVHLDHVGRIPALLAAGFRGPIFCSEPSARLLPLVLEDACRLQGGHHQAQAAGFLAVLGQCVRPLAFAEWHTVLDADRLHCRIRLQRAGHLLGSAYVECDVRLGQQSSRVVFSGDLGAPCNPLLRPLLPPERADLLVLESTYGDRLHPDRSQRRQGLQVAIEHALANSGTILIPAFSLGRTQELLYEIEEVLHAKALLGKSRMAAPAGLGDWAQLPVILDSPLAQRITGVYRELHQYWRAEARQRLEQGRDPLAFGQLVSIDTHARHQQVVNYLKSTGRPAIVIAGNGMCSGGRIVNYLKAMLGDPRHEVMFVGYQARGTPGAVIQGSERAAGKSLVELDGQHYEIRARVVTLGGYSGHADQAGLVRFARGRKAPAGRVLLVHGERRAKQVLAQALRMEYAKFADDLEVIIP